MYDISWTRLVNWLLPHPVRNALNEAWLMCLVVPIVSLHSAFLDYRRRRFYAIQATGQVTKLRFYLNWLFDTQFNRIDIQDAAQDDYIFIYQEYENKPIYLPTFLSGSSYNFVVLIPTEFQFKEAQIRAIINSYKLPTRKYYIIWT
jgi:hypothetical protein